MMHTGSPASNKCSTSNRIVDDFSGSPRGSGVTHCRIIKWVGGSSCWLRGIEHFGDTRSCQFKLPAAFAHGLPAYLHHSA